MGLLHHGEEVILESWSLPKKGIRWIWQTKFVRPDEVCIAEAKVELVFVTKVGTKFKVLRKIPEDFSNTFMALHAGPK